MMLLELDNVTRLYGTVIGINDLNFVLKQGAHGLLGPNGAGKTTLLNLLTGQLSPTIGSVKVLGMNPRGNPQLLRRLGYLPSSEGMYSDVSALEWVTYLTKLQGFGNAQAKQMALKALTRVDLVDHMHRSISTFSRGMRQRTRLAQAISHEPDLLILDEPFSGLDPIARHSMNQLLYQWIQEGRSLIIASHVLHEIESLTRSFLLLGNGRLLASGSTSDMNELLADIPSEVRIRVDKPRVLAAELIREEFADSVKITKIDELFVTTNKPGRLGSFLSRGVLDQRYLVTELHSAEDSLQDVFNSLMKIHRGIV